jgi:hypothetical protein
MSVLLMLLSVPVYSTHYSYVDDGFKVLKEHMPLLAADGQVRTLNVSQRKSPSVFLLRIYMQCTGNVCQYSIVDASTLVDHNQMAYVSA